MKKITALLLLVLMATSQSYADKSGDDVVLIIYGSGVESCGKYVTEYKKNDWPKLIYVSWVQGYLTGKTVLTNKPFDTDALGLWVFNYCTKNPLHTLHRAAVKLSRELDGIN